MGPLIPLFWTSGDVSSGFQSHVRKFKNPIFTVHNGSSGNVTLPCSFTHFGPSHCLRSTRDPLTILYLIWAPVTNLRPANFN